MPIKWEENKQSVVSTSFLRGKNNFDHNVYKYVCVVSTSFLRGKNNLHISLCSAFVRCVYLLFEG